MSMTTDLYIYYRVHPDNAARCQQQITQLQASLAVRWQIVTALKRRPALQDGLQTWMEIYTSVPAEFLAALQQALDQSDAAGLIEGHRHLETFVDLGLCA